MLYDFEQYKNDIRIIPMDESFKLVRGVRYPQKELTPVHLRSVKNSFAMFNIAAALPSDGLLLVEKRTAFAPRHPVGDTMVLRAELDLEDLDADIFIVDALEDDDGIEKADVLLSAGQHKMIYWQYAQLAVIANVPGDAAPGVYTGKVRFYAHAWPYDETLIREVEFDITVEDISVPLGKDRKFFMNLWQHVFNIARKAEVRYYTDEHLNALKPFAESLARLGGRVITVLVSDVPWMGQSCYLAQENISDLYEYNFIRITKGTDGTFSYDFSFADKYIAMMRGYGFDEIMFTGLYGVWMNEKEGFERIIDGWPDGLRLSYRDEKDGCIRFMRTVAELEDYFKALYAWMVKNGYDKTGHFMGDEVNLGQTIEGWDGAMEHIHELMPTMRINWDISPKEMSEPPFDKEPIDIYDPALDAFPYTPDGMWEGMRARIREGGKYLWSVCCWPPVMNSFLHTDLNEVRLHGIMTEYMKLDGFVRWNYTVWPEDPRKNIVYRAWPAGDTCFVYPGKGGQCLLSLRYLALRRGIEDFELMQMLKAAGRQDVLDAAFDLVLHEKDVKKWDFADFEGRERMFSLDHTDYEAARNAIIDALKEEKRK